MTLLQRWFVNPWVQLSICVLLGTVAEIFLKIGAVQTADPANAWSWTGLTGLRSTWVCVLVRPIRAKGQPVEQLLQLALERGNLFQ